MTISDLEQKLTVALKNKETVTAATLRLLLARLKNERIAAGNELSDAEVEAVVQSEWKRRKEAAEEFTKGGRIELASSELAEAEVLLSFLPAQASEADIAQAVADLVRDHNFTTKDFGAAMRLLKEKFGASSDGATLSRILKEKLK